MSTSATFSTQEMPRRRRSHLHVDEAMKLDAVELAPTTSLGDGAEDDLSWPLVGVHLHARVSGDALVLTGGPEETRIRLLPVQIAHGRRWWMFQCPVCGARRRRLYLPYKRTHWACRRCHRLVARRVPRVDVDRIANEIEDLHDQVRRLRCVWGLNEGPVVGQRQLMNGGRDPDPEAIREKIAAMRKFIERLAPPGV